MLHFSYAGFVRGGLALLAKGLAANCPESIGVFDRIVKIMEEHDNPSLVGRPNVRIVKKERRKTE